eukprot:6682106-Prymnesium_polylepis.2
MFAESKKTKPKRGEVGKSIAFVVELLKAKAGKGCGRFGPAAFTELLERARTDNIEEVHLIVRLFDNAADAAQDPPKRSTRTKSALALYEELGFREALANDTILYPDYDLNCQRYMVVSVATLEKNLAGAAQLRGGARWIESTKCRTAPGKDRKYYECEAVMAMVEEHDAANGGDDVKPAALVPRAGRKMMLYAMVPRPPPPQNAEEGEEEEAEADPDAFDYEVTEQAGEVLRTFSDAPDQAITDGVETETSCTEDGVAAESWGNCDVREVLEYILLERLRGHVPLPGKTCGFGVKVSCDAAVVRRARRGKKQWTTVIVQILCTGVDSNAWGRSAVINALHKAQSPNKFAKVRAWQGKDNRENVRCAPSHRPTPADTTRN